MGYKSQADAIYTTLDEIADKAKFTAKITRALNHKLRLRILELIEDKSR